MARTLLQRPDPDTITLSRLVHYLETILSSDSGLLRTPYDRQKASANLEYARTLLLRLEHNSTAIKAPQRRQAAQSDLQLKREKIKTLQLRLQEMNSLPDLGEDDEESSSDESEAELESTVASQMPKASVVDILPTSGDSNIKQQTTSTLRSRKQGHVLLEKGNVVASGNSFSQPKSDVAPAERDTMLSAHRAEQEDLTQSLLSLATQLKSSAQGFNSSLELEKDVLERTSLGLDKNISGMDAAGRRMGTLRRMTEGKGWWGRMLMYAWIAGLWIALFLVMFIMPKLRF